MEQNTHANTLSWITCAFSFGCVIIIAAIAALTYQSGIGGSTVLAASSWLAVLGAAAVISSALGKTLVRTGEQAGLQIRFLIGIISGVAAAGIGASVGLV